ncbi:hypothetical protein HII17_18715 [Thalassotalea sp. M1531]|uniref:Uncharacterized protein n=1 Tax=Thalassotalea algicola TaxID=2716224 RepID=A0A7Y0LFK8_9GAMM|nr:hypothetical protein [Thalassotalea algicola]NMP33585.1 hypothetical protein [Thalassotalea algicola]
MESRKVCRMSILFEKMMSESANRQEQFELKSLYEEFIDDGRSSSMLLKRHKQAVNKRLTH